jgi:DNA polymerase-3 subunit epsilon
MPRTFDELGTPLEKVAFAVVDLETTGGSPAEDAITEIGAVKLRGGECLGTFQTLVNPGSAVPAAITVLTGITEMHVAPAPPIRAVLPALVEFLGGSVIVGHNVRFDLAFLDAALARGGWPRLDNPSVDTAALSRRLVRDEVPDCSLGTLAERLRLDHRPVHRALEDALATADLLHFLLERAAAWGVLGLDDLLALPRLAGHPQVSKLRLTNHLPRLPGVYWFLDGRDVPLYVGKATNLRQRVRSYFSGDDRRQVGGLLRETAAVRYHVASSTLEAAVLEARLIHRLKPRYNRRSTGRPASPYVALTVGEMFPRLKIVRKPKADGSLYLGPLPSTAVACALVDAIQSVVPLRRCPERLGSGPSRPLRADPCLPAQIGVARCPCAGEVGPAEYAPLVHTVIEGITRRPDCLLIPLEDRMAALAAARRYEEAALVRDRAGALSSTLRRQRRLDELRATGLMRLQLPGGVQAELRNGILVDPPPVDVPFSLQAPTACPPGHGGPLSQDVVLELLTVAAWLDREAHRVSLLHCDGPVASVWPALPSFTPGQRSITAPAWSMRRISARPPAGSAAATASERSGEQSVAMVGPEPDSHPHQAPAASAISSAAREAGVSSRR